MSKIDSHVIDELVNNINNKKLVSKSDKKSIYEDKSNICRAAKKITTYGAAFKLVEEGKNVYLVKESDKISAYIRCSKTLSDSCDYCNIHTRMSKLNNEGLKRYDDIIPDPSDPSDKNRWLATIKDEYFDNMRKKKENLSDPITMILQNKRSKAYFMLSEYARELILNNLNNEKVVDSKKKITKPASKKSNNDNVSSKRKTTKYEDETEKYAAKAVESESDTESDDEGVDEVIDTVMSAKKEEEVDDIEELDGNDFIHVVASNGKSYYIKDDDAYCQNDEEEGTFIDVGVLTEVKKRYATIEYDGKHYTIIKNRTHSRKGDILLCVVSNKIYDSNMKYIGDGIKKCPGTNYELKFFDEL